MDLTELEKLMAERQDLLKKVSSNEITKEESNRLDEIETRITKIEDEILANKYVERDENGNPKDEKIEEQPTEPAPKGKGFKFTPEISMKQKRLGATGFSVKDGEIHYIIPKEVKELQLRQKEKKKKMKKIAKASKKKNR